MFHAERWKKLTRRQTQWLELDWDNFMHLLALSDKNWLTDTTLFNEMMKMMFEHWQWNSCKDQWFWFSACAELLYLCWFSKLLSSNGINGIHIAKLWFKHLFRCLLAVFHVQIEPLRCNLMTLTVSLDQPHNKCSRIHLLHVKWCELAWVHPNTYIVALRVYLWFRFSVK